MPEQEALLRRKAMDLLAAREYSYRELLRKLKRYEADEAVVGSVLDRLQEECLLSDERFAEAFVNSRRNRGYGPIRIRQELKQAGIDNDLIHALIDEGDELWLELAKEVYQKKFGQRPPADRKEQARRFRFMVYRGFSPKFMDVVELNSEV